MNPENKPGEAAGDALRQRLLEDAAFADILANGADYRYYDHRESERVQPTPRGDRLRQLAANLREAAACLSPHKWQGLWQEETSDNLSLVSRINGLEATVLRLRTALQYVVNRFTKDEADGYRSRDRQFAIEVLSQALADPLPAVASSKVAGIDFPLSVYASTLKCGERVHITAPGASHCNCGAITKDFPAVASSGETTEP